MKQITVSLTFDVSTKVADTLAKALRTFFGVLVLIGWLVVHSVGVADIPAPKQVAVTSGNHRKGGKAKAQQLDLIESHSTAIDVLRWDSLADWLGIESVGRVEIDKRLAEYFGADEHALFIDFVDSVACRDIQWADVPKSAVGGVTLAIEAEDDSGCYDFGVGVTVLPPAGKRREHLTKVQLIV